MTNVAQNLYLRKRKGRNPTWDAWTSSAASGASRTRSPNAEGGNKYRRRKVEAIILSHSLFLLPLPLPFLCLFVRVPLTLFYLLYLSISFSEECKLIYLLYIQKGGAHYSYRSASPRSIRGQWARSAEVNLNGRPGSSASKPLGGRRSPSHA